jgi:hypothetical protein
LFEDYFSPHLGPLPNASLGEEARLQDVTASFSQRRLGLAWRDGTVTLNNASSLPKIVTKNRYQKSLPEIFAKNFCQKKRILSVRVRHVCSLLSPFLSTNFFL